MKYKMVILNNDLRLDLLSTALEGGSNYWYNLDLDEVFDKRDRFSKSISETIFDIIKSKESIPIYDLDTDEILGNLSLSSIEEGEDILEEKYFHYLENIFDGNWDADDADAWFQCVVMGEIIFG